MLLDKSGVFSESIISVTHFSDWMKGDGKFAERTTMNLSTEILCVVLTTIIGLVMVPYYIDRLGIAAYAVVPLATSVSSYMIIIANSFSNAINRFFVQALRKGDRDVELMTYSTSLRLMVLIAAILMPITAVVSYFTPDIFNVPEGSYTSVRILFLCEFWSSIFLNFGTCFNNALVAYNKTYVINTIRSSYLALQILTVVVLFAVFVPSLEQIGYAYMVGITLYVVASYIVMKREFPELHYVADAVNNSHMKEIGALAFWSAVVRIGNLLFLQASLILTNLYLGAETEGGFSLVVSMVSMVGTACNAVTNIFYPFYHKFYADKDRSSFIGIAVLGIRTLSLVVAMPLAYVCIFSPEVFTFWVGGEYVYLKNTVWVMFFLLIFYATVGVIETIPTILLKVKEAAIITLILGLLNIVLAVILLSFTDLGILGVAAAYTISMFLRNGIIFPIFISKSLRCSLTKFINPMFGGFIVFLVGLGYCYVFSLFWDVQGTIVSVLVSFIVMFAIFFYLAIRFGLTRKEKSMLEEAMPKRLSLAFGKIFCD